jgi:hypothetical protein
LIIPNNITSIGARAFEDCSGFETLTISNNIKVIDDYAFRDCLNLKSITFNDFASNPA